ncbi:MAG: CvpA family protein [Synergistaceae bacterium]|jgi:membrane protein required for colicin V production|nr:CvpA family protein [Synergistaceae bacterium]
MSVANIFDIGAACLLAFCVVRGGLRGLTGEIVSLVGLAVSVACGWSFAKPLAAEVLNRYPGWDRTLIELACAVGVFIAVSLVFAVLGKMLRALVKAANLSLLDHVMGVVAGSLRALLVVLFVYGVLSVFSPMISNEWMEESLVMKQVAVVWPAILDFLTTEGWLDLSHLTTRV